MLTLKPLIVSYLIIRFLMKLFSPVSLIAPFPMAREENWKHRILSPEMTRTIRLVKEVSFAVLDLLVLFWVLFQVASCP